MESLIFFSIYLFLPAFLGFTQPLTEMSTLRFLGVKGGRRVSRLCRQCGVLVISQPHRLQDSFTFSRCIHFVCNVAYIVCVLCFVGV
jgi:hypothetical protein